MREQILKALRKMDYVSGKNLANELGVSKVAIWKHIQALRELEYSIESKPGKGYYLTEVPDKLLPYEIKMGLNTRFVGNEIHHYEQVGSTQDISKELAENGVKEGTIVISESQGEGKGRRSREWFSPEGGLYLSLILRPNIPPAQTPLMSLLGGVAVARAVNEICGLEAGLKWPNDIQIKNTKLGGVLVEMSAEADHINWVTIGIGLNVNNELSFLPEDIRDTATTLKNECGGEVPRVELVRHILVELEEQYINFKKRGSESVLEEWKKLSNTLGASVRVSNGKIFEGKAVDLGKRGELIIETADGELIVVSAGDVSLTKK